MESARQREATKATRTRASESEHKKSKRKHPLNSQAETEVNISRQSWIFAIGQRNNNALQLLMLPFQNSTFFLEIFIIPGNYLHNLLPNGIGQPG